MEDKVKNKKEEYETRIRESLNKIENLKGKQWPPTSLCVEKGHLRNIRSNYREHAKRNGYEMEKISYEKICSNNA